MAASRMIVAAVFLLEIVAFGLAIAAESRRHHVTAVKVSRSDGSTTYYCRYARDAATGLGATAFALLLIGHSLMSGVTRCLCCSTPLRPGIARILAIILFLLSWFTFVIAEICLLAGSSRAAFRVRFSDDGALDCKSLRRGIFSAGAAFTFFTLLLSEAYYLCFVRAQDKGAAWSSGAAPYNPGGAAPYGAPYGATAPPYAGAPPPYAGGSIGMSAYPPR